MGSKKLNYIKTTKTHHLLKTSKPPLYMAVQYEHLH